jgi:hypothetical protein
MQLEPPMNADGRRYGSFCKGEGGKSAPRKMHLVIETMKFVDSASALIGVHRRFPAFLQGELHHVAP